MNKTMLALTLSALAGTAAAQSNVTVYGIVDMAVVRESGGVGAAASSTKLTSGVESGSRLGFKGAEDLGNGLSAIFLLENRPLPRSSAPWGRAACCSAARPTSACRARP